MSKSTKASKVYLPDSSDYNTILDFLVDKFPHVSKEEWIQRMREHQVYRDDKSLIKPSSPYLTGHVYYHRQVSEEPAVPFDESIIEHNDHYLIAYKPHFLPVMPGGAFVNECLQNRLIKKTGNNELQAIHRLDRDTAGLVLFSTNPETRSQYHELFSQKDIDKEYLAVAELFDKNIPGVGQKWHVKNYLARSEPKFLFKNIDKPSDVSRSHYAESIIECIEVNNSQALFKLQPITGRTHQLRLHMQYIGYPILNDRFYPKLQPKSADNYDQPLKLLAYRLSFTDPVSQRQVRYQSPVTLTI